MPCISQLLKQPTKETPSIFKRKGLQRLQLSYDGWSHLSVVKSVLGLHFKEKAMKSPNTREPPLDNTSIFFVNSNLNKASCRVIFKVYQMVLRELSFWLSRGRITNKANTKTKQTVPYGLLLQEYSIPLASQLFLQSLGTGVCQRLQIKSLSYISLHRVCYFRRAAPTNQLQMNSK